MMSLITAAIPLVAMIGKWLIDRNAMSNEAKKHFLLWIKQSAADGAISVKLRESYRDLIAQHLSEGQDVTGNNQ